MSGSVGGYSRTLPELPADALCCAAGWGKALPGLSSSQLAARSHHGPGVCQRPPAEAVLFLPVGFIFRFFHPITFSGRSGSIYLPVNPHVMASLHSWFQKLPGPLSAASGLAGW